MSAKPMARLNLVVLRARNAPRLASFYSGLGLKFVRHRHGAGPEHFAGEEGGGIFEIRGVQLTTTSAG
jgi:lactoylglutathione lyase